jgi:phospholipid/cholesterol/gamma-HCH transport system substrate-binding protein
MTIDTQERYEIRVGIFTIVAVILFLFGWGWLKSISWFHEPQRFTVQFHDIAGMNKNATVNINGVRVGVIEDIELKARGQVLVHPKITAPNVVVPRGSMITIQTLGLIGAKYLEVTLPAHKPGEPIPPPLEPSDVVIGEDPVRTELIVNQVANLVKDVVGGGKGKTLAANMSQAVTSINKVANRIDGSMDHFEGVADNASAFFGQGKSTLQNVSDLSVDLRGTDQKLNKILDRPLVSQDLKDVMAKAENVSQQISAAVNQLNSTVGNDATRQDLVTIMNKMSDSTNNIEQSLQILNSMSKDKDLRGDLKHLISQASDALDKVHSLMDKRSDLRDTIGKVRSAATNVNIAAQELQEALQHRRPLLHLMFGKGMKVPASGDVLVVPADVKSDVKPSDLKSAPVVTPTIQP